MEIRKIIFPTSLDKINEDRDNIDVFVETNLGTYTVTVCTPQFYVDYMDKEQKDYVPSGGPDIIVRKLTEEIITKAIEHYSEDDGYWLKFYGEVEK